MHGTLEASVTLIVSTPSPPQQDCDPFLDSTLVKAIKTIAYSMLLIFSLAGNSLVIAVIFRNRKLRTVINFLILNIAISDLFLPLFAHTRRIKQVYLPLGLWPLDGVIGSTTCKLATFATDTLLIVSILTLEVIAIERFASVVFPLKKQPIRSNKACFIVIVLTWVLAAAYSSSQFYSRKLIHKGSTPYCEYTWQPAFDHAEAVKIEVIISLVSFTMIPFVLLTSLYSAVIISLHRQKGNLHLARQAIQRRAKENRQITYMLVTVVVVFLVTWLPLNIYSFLNAFVWSSHRPCESRHLIFSANFLCYISSAVNPFIYCLFMRNYRKGYQELFECLRRGRTCCKNQNLAPEVEDNIDFNVQRGSSNAAVLIAMRSCEMP